MEDSTRESTKFGIIEAMDNGQFFGYVRMHNMTDEYESSVIDDYLDAGWIPISSECSLVGGKVTSLNYVSIGEDGKQQETDVPYILHGLIVMKTLLKKNVSTKDK